MNIEEHVKTVTHQALIDGEEKVHSVIFNEMMTGMIKAALIHTGGNQSKASKVLGINRGTLRKYIEKYELKIRLGVA